MFFYFSGKGSNIFGPVAAGVGFDKEFFQIFIEVIFEHTVIQPGEILYILADIRDIVFHPVQVDKGEFVLGVSQGVCFFINEDMPDVEVGQADFGVVDFPDRPGQ